MFRFHEQNVFEPSGTFTVFVNNESPRSFMCLANVRILMFSNERAWITLVSTTGLSVLSEDTVSSWKELTSISWERTFFFHLEQFSCHSWTGLPVLSRFWFRISWFDWKLLDICPTSGRWACSEPNSLFHSCFKEIFGGGRGDMYTFSYKTSPISILTTFGIQWAGSVSWRMIAFDQVW